MSVVCLVAARAWAGEGPTVSVFGPGEQTTYEVSVFGIPAGVATVTVGSKVERYGAQVWPLVCDGRTAKVGAVFPVRDRFVSYWDPVRRRALGADFFVDENGERRRERYRYDEELGKAVAVKQREGKPPVEIRYDMHQGTMDLASAGFSLRNTPLQLGSVYEIPVFTGVRTYRMRATVESRGPVETRLGAVDAFRVTVNGDFDGNLVTKGLMTVYFTTDARQLPIRAEAELLLGKIAIEATAYEPGRDLSRGLQ